MLEAVEDFEAQHALASAEELPAQEGLASADAPALEQQAALGEALDPAGAAVTAVWAEAKANPPKVSPNTKSNFFILLCFVQI